MTGDLVDPHGHLLDRRGHAGGRLALLLGAARNLVDEAARREAASPTLIALRCTCPTMPARLAAISLNWPATIANSSRAENDTRAGVVTAGKLRGAGRQFLDRGEDRQISANKR